VILKQVACPGSGGRQRGKRPIYGSLRLALAASQPFGQHDTGPSYSLGRQFLVRTVTRTISGLPAAAPLTAGPLPRLRSAPPRGVSEAVRSASLHGSCASARRLLRCVSGLTDRNVGAVDEGTRSLVSCGLAEVPAAHVADRRRDLLRVPRRRPAMPRSGCVASGNRPTLTWRRTTCRGMPARRAPGSESAPGCRG
jgi:hypothetical protein